MDNSNLVELLKTFSKKEMKDFDKFLRSPYFTEGKNIRHKILFKYFSKLKVYHPEFADGKFSKKSLFQILYPGSDFNDGIMRKLNSDLLILAEKFLTIEEFSKDRFEGKISYLNSLTSRKADRLFLKSLKTTERILEVTEHDSNFFRRRDSLNLMKHRFAFYKDDMFKMYDLQKYTDNFLLYYISKSLELWRDMENDRSMLKINYKPYLMLEVISHLENNSDILKENPLIAIHFNELLLHQKKTDEQFYKLISLKNLYLDLLSIDALHNLYTTLVNYTIRKANEGIERFRTERFDLDREILMKDLYRNTEFIEMNYFLSAVRNAAYIGKFKWAEKFIDEYSVKLDPKHKHFAVNYVRAILCFRRKEFGRALEFLSRINTEYSSKKMLIKNLMIVLFYETGSFENALSVIDTTKHFLSNEKQLAESRKLSNATFLKFIASLINLRSDQDKLKIADLEAQVMKSRFFIFREWLLEKIAELNIIK